MYLDFSDLLDNAITSSGSIKIYNGVDVTGDVTAGGTVDNHGDVDGTITEGATLNWPTADDLSPLYWNDVKDLEPPFPYNHPMDIAGTETTIEALYRDDDWKITNGVPTEATLTLNGTVYVKGDLEIGNTGHNFTLNLNGQTIFVESASADPQKAIEIGGKCTIIGSGCIIAVGDVYFAPDGDVGSENDFILILSVEGTTTLQPSGTFNGCVAGDVCVEVKSGVDATINWTDPNEHNLNFPMGDDNEEPWIAAISLASWQIS